MLSADMKLSMSSLLTTTTGLGGLPSIETLCWLGSCNQWHGNIARQLMKIRL